MKKSKKDIQELVKTFSEKHPDPFYKIGDVVLVIETEKDLPFNAYVQGVIYRSGLICEFDETTGVEKNEDRGWRYWVKIGEHEQVVCSQSEIIKKL